MLPSYLQADFSNYKHTVNQFQRFHKIINFSFSLLKTYVILTYCNLKYTEVRNQRIEKYINDNFQRPTEGAWLSFLELLLSLKFDKESDPRSLFKINISNSNSKKLNEIYKIALNLNEIIDTNNTIFMFFQKITSLKNRLISHGMISEDTAERINPILDSVLGEIIVNTKEYLNTKLFLISDNNNDYSWKIHNYNTNEEESQLDTSNIKESGLYFLLNKKLIQVWPLLACRDGNIIFYNRFDKTSQKVFFSVGINKETYIRSDVVNHIDLFGFNKELIFRKPLDVNVKTENDISHNLPEKDYNLFIGRDKEINELNRALDHKRHFITALDGIGGVGKSAIAIESCYRLINDSNNDFEYFVWMSAKNTFFKDGKITIIEQAFDHLDQLIDTILIVLGFTEFIQFEMKKKKETVIELLTFVKMLLVLDNLETIKPENFADIWNFINNEIPSPSKILLTSREYPQSVPQTIRVEYLNDEDSLTLVDIFSNEIGITKNYMQGIRKEIVQLSSGLPIVIKSILGQISLGKNINIIKKEIDNNTDNISKFCFEQQLTLLDIDQKTVLWAICLSSDVLDHDALIYLVSDLITSPLLDIIKKLSSLSIIKINYLQNATEYLVLSLIKTYILNSNKDNERVDEIKKRLNEFHELKDVENYNLLPIEEKVIERGSLIPRKIVDKAMQHSSYGEFEQAEIMFKKAIRDYENETYVWYMYSQFYAQYKADYKNAIECLKKAHELSNNYIYLKKIGDYHLKNRNYRMATKNYVNAMKSSTLEKNKIEMLYLIAQTEYEQVRQLRSAIKYTKNIDNINERNELYKSIINNLDNYIESTPHIYDGKRIKIYRILSEAHFGLRNREEALENIDLAIELSEGDETHIEYKNLIMAR
jgi:tetratricopeptide (TPR) repeat protein